MKIVKINQKPQDSLYTPVRSLMDDFFNFPTRWDDLYLRDFDNLSANIWEEENKIYVKMAMPGVKKEDIKISVTGDTLSIEGESKQEKEEKEKKYFLKTFQSCSYSQSFNLPSLVNPDGVEAKFEDGVLTITLPKAKESESKQISIK
ncbi:Hsp20/alpha crystallin family protein [Candidatus Dojkabacteria bacterium]|uniref:Hsp20/alpha crystallin family protein n=1 Tax=Candidatus Dojkabacteria bacterium TaxID=2099670 RepID=A0A847ETD1_9BACT|nr:Hsp20/alpha crystallin family protein [Candidatus Dojkabacteria bacterium]